MKTHPEYVATGSNPAQRVQDDCAVQEEESQIPPQSRADEFVLARPLPYTSIVLDLGDVLAFYSPTGLDLPVSSSIIKRVITSGFWAELECGQLSRAECLSRAGRDFSIQAQDIEETLRLLGGTLKYNTELVDLVHHIKSASCGELKVYLATNITSQDWEILRPTVESWQVFDGIFPSFELGARKPQGTYFQRLLDKIGRAPENALFIDDKPDNIVAARALGMPCIQYTGIDKAIAAIKNAFGDPLARGKAWLSAHAGEMWSETNTGVVIHDTFAQLMVLENTSQPNLVTLPEKTSSTWNFFHGKPALTTSVYPDDLDTTSLAFRNVKGIREATKHAVMDEMLKYMDEDGLFNIYFDHNRPRVDIHITANILRLFHAHGRTHQLSNTLSYMAAVARTRAYESATLYYLHPDWFFYHLSELFAISAPLASDNDYGTNTTDHIDRRGSDGEGDQDLAELRTLLKTRLAERFGNPDHSDPWSLALRLVAARNLGFRCKTFSSSSSSSSSSAVLHGADEEDGLARDLRKLRLSQERDGSFGAGQPWIYRYGHGVLIGNVGLITAVAVRALESFS